MSKAIRMLDASIAGAIAIGVFEVAGAHGYINRFAHRGNVANVYYWLFLGAVVAFLLVTSVVDDHPWSRKRAATLVVAGAIGGYLFSLVIFHASLIANLGGVAATIARWKPLGAYAVVVAAMTPLALLAPVLGAIIFAGYTGIRRYRHLHK